MNYPGYSALTERIRYPAEALGLDPLDHAVRIALWLLIDLTGRGGFGGAWDDTDQETRMEIVLTWVDKIRPILLESNWILTGDALRRRILDACPESEDGINAVFDAITVPMSPMTERDRLVADLAEAREALVVLQLEYDAFKTTVGSLTTDPSAVESPDDATKQCAACVKTRDDLVASRPAWRAIADEHPAGASPSREILLGSAAAGIMGRFTGFKASPKYGDAWYIDDCLYDGDDPPTHWILLPKVPTC